MLIRKSAPHPRSRKTPRGGRMMAKKILQMSLEKLGQLSWSGECYKGWQLDAFRRPEKSMQDEIIANSEANHLRGSERHVCGGAGRWLEKKSAMGGGGMIWKREVRGRDRSSHGSSTRDSGGVSYCVITSWFVTLWLGGYLCPAATRRTRVSQISIVILFLLLCDIWQ